MLHALSYSSTWEEPWDEAAAIERALADRAEFAPLYHHYAARIFQYLLTRCDSPDEAADAFQIVFLRALEALPSLRRRHERSFGAWLFRIAHNVASDSKRRRRPTVPWEDVPETALLAGGPDPEAAALRHETFDVLRQLIAELSPRQQEVIALRFAAELTIPEIAAVVHRSEAAVRKQLLRTVRTLQERFDERRP